MERTIGIETKYGLWGVDLLILLTVGVSEFGFDRLLKIVDDLCSKGIINEEVIAQTNYSKYKPINYNSFNVIDRETFEKYVEESRLIICHAGTGTVVPSLKKGKKIIIFPRLKEFNEHIDNHQLELAGVFSNKGYVLCATNEDELIECLNNIDSFKPQIFESNAGKIDDIIIDFIESNSR